MNSIFWPFWDQNVGPCWVKNGKKGYFLHEQLIIIGSHISQMDENQIDLDRENLFFFRYSKIGLKIIFSKILPHIGNRQ